MTPITVAFRDLNQNFITSAEMVAVPRVGETVRLPVFNSKWETHTVVGVHHHILRPDLASPTRSVEVTCRVKLIPE